MMTMMSVPMPMYTAASWVVWSKPYPLPRSRSSDRTGVLLSGARRAAAAGRRCAPCR